MNTRTLLLQSALLAAALLVPSILLAAAPDAIPYQGRVSVGGVNFTGTGQFKFAVYQHATGAFAPATAMARITGGFLTSVTVAEGGGGYSSSVSVTFTGGGGSGATATATVDRGMVTAVTVNSAGTGYTSAPTVVFTDAAGPSQFWNSAAGATTAALAEPASAVSIPVTNGLYVTGLGDTAVSGMAILPTSLAPAAGKRAFVRVWFNDGNHGFQAITPDAELRSVPFAREAANATSLGGIALTNFARTNTANTFTSVDGVTVTGTGPLNSTTPATGAAVPLTGAGSRMEFLPGYSAFRAGTVDAAQWDPANIGIYSTALGYDTTASGEYSTAMGYRTTASGIGSTAFGGFTSASGYFSTALGVGTVASGNYSTAMGDDTSASGNYSTAMGNYTTASGDYSTAMGSGTTAESGYETVIGRYDTDYTPASTTGWNSGDRLFVIGNGTGGLARSNALIVYKNGSATLKGTLTQGSDRNRKHDIVPADTVAVLAKVAALPIATWVYNDETVTHLGPMAQDFFAAFQLGGTDTGIATVDADGVALAAIQELAKRVEFLTAANTDKDEKIATLEARLAAIEAKLK